MYISGSKNHSGCGVENPLEETLKAETLGLACLARLTFWPGEFFAGRGGGGGEAAVTW